MNMQQKHTNSANNKDCSDTAAVCQPAFGAVEAETVEALSTLPESMQLHDEFGQTRAVSKLANGCDTLTRHSHVNRWQGRGAASERTRDVAHCCVQCTLIA